MKWTFKPLGPASEGTLVFYFHMKGREGVVLSPAEMRAVLNPTAKNVKREEEPQARPITQAEFRALPTKPGPLLLDIRDRVTFGEGHEKGAVNIPLRELLPRGPAELPAARHIVIDCRDPPDFCAVGAHFLTSSGFTLVSILQR
jgi:rhodanese-related sulfurtransferase